MVKPAAATIVATAAARMPLCMNPPQGGYERTYKNRAGRALPGKNSGLSRASEEIFKRRNCADKLVGVLLNWYAVVHLVDPQDLRVAAVASQLVVLAHD